MVTKCKRCPIMCGYGPISADHPELEDAPKNYNPLPEGYLRETSEGMKNDLKEFCTENFKEA